MRIGVNWGSLDQALLTRMMDENSRLAEPKDARDVTMEAMVASALQFGASWPSGTACATTGSSSAPKSAACRT